MINIEYVYFDMQSVKEKVDNLEQNIKKLIINKDFTTDERWGVFTKFCTDFKKGLHQSRIEFPNKNFQKYLQAKTDADEYFYNEEVELNWCFSDYYQEQVFLEHNENVLLEEMNKLQEFCMENFVFTFLNCN